MGLDETTVNGDPNFEHKAGDSRGTIATRTIRETPLELLELINVYYLWSHYQLTVVLNSNICLQYNNKINQVLDRVQLGLCNIDTKLVLYFVVQLVTPHIESYGF